MEERFINLADDRSDTQEPNSAVVTLDDRTNLNESHSSNSENSDVILSPEKKGRPKRILHFSDGTLEEFSTDEEEEKCADQVDNKALVNPANLTWAPYVWYQVTRLGNNTLAVCDYLGEHLANFFGITSPKYQFEIDEYFRMKAEQEKENDDVEMRGWKEKSTVALVTNCGGKETVAVQPISDKPDMERPKHLLMREKDKSKYSL